MIDPINMSTLLSLAAMITAFGTAWLTIRKIAKDMEKQKKIQAASILQSAKEADAVLIGKLEAKIHDLETNVKVMKDAHERDIEHLKETYSSEFKNLGAKIEELRDELRQQSQNILGLLSKMIDRKD